MGNAVSSAFDVKDQVASGGPSNLWRIHNASRKSTGQPCSVFIFEKNYLDSMNPLANKASVQVKKDQDRANEILKKEAQNLSRLRHPSMLEVTEAPADSPTALAFATESVLCCLSNVLGTFTNFGNASRQEFKEKFDLDEIEIQKGILQIVKGLEFLHANKWIHGCLSPESIYINSKGDWKIAGFNFSVNTAANPSSAFYFNDYPPFCCPQLDYLAPELVLEDRCTPESDIWSLGCLIFAVFNGGTPPIVCNNNTHSFKNRISELHRIDFRIQAIPPRLSDSLQLMLQRDPSARLSLQDFQKSEFFESIQVSTINFLETFVEKTQMQKAQFLKGLVRMLPQFSKKIINRKILPALLQELKDPAMSPFVLPNIFWIAENITNAEFASNILPSLKPVFRMTDPPQAVMLLLSRMDLLMKKCPTPEVFKQDVLPLLYGALEIPVLQVQEQAVKMVPTSLHMTANSLAVRINSLICIHAMIKSLDKFTLVEKVLPMLKGNKIREPGIMIAILAVYEELAKNLDKEVIATDILPELWKMALDQMLNVTQFKKFMKVIHDLTTRVEEQHLKVLQELKAVEGASDDTQGKDFESLVRDSRPKATADSPDSSQSNMAFGMAGLSLKPTAGLSGSNASPVPSSPFVSQGSLNSSLQPAAKSPIIISNPSIFPTTASSNTSRAPESSAYNSSALPPKIPPPSSFSSNSSSSGFASNFSSSTSNQLVQPVMQPIHPSIQPLQPQTTFSNAPSTGFANFGSQSPMTQSSSMGSTGFANFSSQSGSMHSMTPTQSTPIMPLSSNGFQSMASQPGSQYPSSFNSGFNTGMGFNSNMGSTLQSPALQPVSSNVNWGLASQKKPNTHLNDFDPLK
ncbi:SCY1-like protein 2 [Blyttiomyces sp. JEL0837]|nr:SCY1-like protein 2 [Blyttiomyces sp. JEL0837]